MAKAFLGVRASSDGTPPGFLNVRNYGAVGDGVIDDTKSFQDVRDAIIGSLKSHDSTNASLLGNEKRFSLGMYIPPGDYLITKPRAFYDPGQPLDSPPSNPGQWLPCRGYEVRGAGMTNTCVIYRPSSPGPLVDASGTLVNGTWRDLTIGADQKDAVFWMGRAFKQSAGFTFDRCSWRGMWNYVFQLSNNNLGDNNSFFNWNDCRIGVNAGTNAFLYSGTDVSYESAVHTGATNAITLTSSTIQEWTVNSLVGLTLTNNTDGSTGTIVSNTAETVTVDALVGGSADFTAGDSCTIDYSSYYTGSDQQLWYNFEDCLLSVTCPVCYMRYGGQVNVHNSELLARDAHTFTGTHTGDAGSASLTDSTQNWYPNQLVGSTVTNTTKAETGVVTSNTKDTVTVAMSGSGTFGAGDSYSIPWVYWAFECGGKVNADHYGGSLGLHIRDMRGEHYSTTNRLLHSTWRNANIVIDGYDGTSKASGVGAVVTHEAIRLDYYDKDGPIFALLNSYMQGHIAVNHSTGGAYPAGSLGMIKIENTTFKQESLKDYVKWDQVEPHPRLEITESCRSDIDTSPSVYKKTATALQLQDKEDIHNVINKEAGTAVRVIDDNTMVYASGPLTTDHWYTAEGVDVYTPA